MASKISIQIDAVTARISGLFQPYLPALKPDARIVDLTGDDIRILRACRGKSYSIDYARNRIVVFSKPFVTDDGTLADEFFIAVIGNLDLTSANGVSLMPKVAGDLYPLSAFGDIRLRRNVNPKEVDMYISPVIGGDGVVDQSELLRFFQNFSIYQVSTEAELEEAYVRTLVYNAYLDDQESHSLEFSEDLVNEFRDALTDPDLDHLLADAFVAVSWHACYAAIFRCIEPLFTNILAKMLRRTFLITSHDHMQVTQLLQVNGAIIPNEETNICNLFHEALPQALETDFMAVLSMPANSTRKSIGRKVYSIRNAIIHHPESASKKKDLDNMALLIKDMGAYDWDRVCLTLLRAYRAFKSHMASLP